MQIHGSRVMESVKPILDSEARPEDVKEQVNQAYGFVSTLYRSRKC